MAHRHELKWGAVLPEGMEGTRWRRVKGEKIRPTEIA